MDSLPDSKGESDSPLKDNASFQARFEQCARGLYAWAGIRIRSAGFGGGIDPQDLVQEIWVRGAKNALSFDPARGSFQAWLQGIGKNVLLEMQREARRLRRLGSMASPSQSFTCGRIPDPASSLTQRLARDESVQRFIELAVGLPRSERRLLTLLGLEGLPTSEVATRTGASVEAVRKQWQRLRSKLRDSPDAREFVPG